MKAHALGIATLLLVSCQDAETPATALLDASQLPDYEAHLDHASLIGALDDEFYHRGMNTYRTACFSCHGNLEQPGSIPNSRQFWSEPLQNGADPYALYQTLTLGYGLMPPQPQLTPREKYGVIHFMREEFLREHNPGQHTAITDEYLSRLPPGDTLGPRPVRLRPWAEMDYGNFLMRTYEVAHAQEGPKGISGGASPLANEDFRDRNFAYKGIAVRLDPGTGGVAAGEAFALFDHDLLRLAAFWTGEGFIDYEDILLDNQHNVFPRIVGALQFENPMEPGWANPETDSFEDPRLVAVDGRRFGPLPREWAHYKGLYYHGNRTVIHYSVAGTDVLETYDLESPGVLSRTLNISPAARKLRLRVAPLNVHVTAAGTGGELGASDGFHVLTIPEGSPARMQLWMAAAADAPGEHAGEPEDLTRYTRGAPAHYPQVLTTPILRGDDGAYAVDVITLPQDIPWKSRMRPTGIDFTNEGRTAIVSTIDGEVWRLDGILRDEGPVTWRRIATGLFQPLGVKVLGGDVYVGCRDQIAVLRDLNGDGETDYYQSFNSDHIVTEHFHEFAMGLQTDANGNFYYAKSARHARTALVSQHGTLIRVDADGKRSAVIANGFRAANGVLLNPDGSFIVTDQEGHWNPMNRINWVEEGGFYGNMYGYGAPADSSDGAMAPPLVWIDQKTDRSPAELVRARSDRWGPLGDHLLSLSYGYGKIFAVLPQFFDGVRQGAVAELPVPQFPTGIMRGRFNPEDGQLYVLGMSAWATNQMIQVGGLYRVRYTGAPLQLPVSMRALQGALELGFAEPLEQAKAEMAESYTITTWDLRRSRRYGSSRYNTKTLPIDGVALSGDGKLIRLAVPDLAPTWVIEVSYDLASKRGTTFSGLVQGTLHALEHP